MNESCKTCIHISDWRDKEHGNYRGCKLGMIPPMPASFDLSTIRCPLWSNKNPVPDKASIK